MEEIPQEKSDALIKKSEEYAKKSGLKLNKNKKLLEAIIKGLLMNEKKNGAIYCPCRRLTGNKEEDKKIICPCIYHLDEIKEMGHCHCGLFTK